jgi:hypothetical protein
VLVEKPLHGLANRQTPDLVRVVGPLTASADHTTSADLFHASAGLCPLDRAAGNLRGHANNVHFCLRHHNFDGPTER